MSTISSGLDSSATIGMNDFYRRYVNRATTENQSMRVLYGATLAWGGGGKLIALAMTRVPSALDAWWMLAGIFGGGVLGLFLLGLLSRRAGKPAAVCGVTAGVLLFLWMALSPQWTGLAAEWRSPFHGFITIVFGTATSLVVGLLLASTLESGGQPSKAQPPARNSLDPAAKEGL